MTSEELDELERLWLRKVPKAEIAKQMGYSVEGINYWLQKLPERFSKRKCYRVDKKRAELLAARVMGGRMTIKEMAVDMGVNYETARRWVRRYEAEMAGGPGEAPGMEKVR